ncbi:MAG: hypothetical protein P8X85_01345 [Desulfobacterales bacterium]|jgi:hypothetical protein
MKETQKKIINEDSPEEVTKVGLEERSLILLPPVEKKNEDVTISSRGRYVSRFHYSTQNLDKYMEYCPHCKKPTMTAFHNTVIDNAIDYLEGRRVLARDPVHQSRLLKYSTGFVAVGAAVYFILLPLIFSGHM